MLETTHNTLMGRSLHEQCVYSASSEFPSKIPRFDYSTINVVEKNTQMACKFNNNYKESASNAFNEKDWNSIFL